MGTTGNGTSARWDWSFDGTSEGVLVLRLSGSWRKHDHLPTRAAIEHGLGARRNARALAFDTRGIETWDSGFVVFVLQVLEASRGLHLAEDLTGLPVGVRKLLELAAAVPERKTGRGVPPAPLLARLGTAAARAVGAAREMITFLGEACLALARWATGRARLRRADLMVTIQEAGPEALGIVSLISFLVGLILAYVGAVQLRLLAACILLSP